MHMTVAAVIGGNSVPAAASYNCFGGADKAGADKRGSSDPVAENPAETSGPYASPVTVPDGGYPNSDQGLGTPSVIRVLVGLRSGRVG